MTTEHFHESQHFYFKHQQVQLCISSQKKEEVLPPEGRKLRPRRGPVAAYIEDTSEEGDYENEEKKEEARSKPIAACYLRGPPISPRPPNKQV